MDFLRDMNLLKGRLDAQQAALRQEKLRSRALGEEAVALQTQVEDCERRVRAREAEACKFERCAAGLLRLFSCLQQALLRTSLTFCFPLLSLVSVVCSKVQEFRALLAHRDSQLQKTPAQPPGGTAEKEIIAQVRKEAGCCSFARP